MGRLACPDHRMSVDACFQAFSVRSGADRNDAVAGRFAAALSALRIPVSPTRLSRPPTQITPLSSGFPSWR